MREIFAGTTTDPGRVFYTITQADIGKSIIQTEIGAIYVGDVIGRVQPADVGKRLYRVPADATDHWIWQCESEGQRDARLTRKLATGPENYGYVPAAVIDAEDTQT